MTTKISLVGSPEAALAAVRTHAESFPTPTDQVLAVLATVSALEAGLSVSGTLAYARAGNVELFGHTNDVPQLVDLYVPDEDANLWRAPLASAATMTVQATRGTLTLPVMEDAAIVRVLHDRFVLAGFVPPAEEPNGDAPHVPEWVQRGPVGLQNGYMLGEMAVRGGKVWTQGLDLPESAPGALNGGNYAEPGTGGVTGWITHFGEAEPMWEAGNVYTQPATVRWPNNGTDGPLHRYTLATASENSAAGREPHHAYMWAVWTDEGPV